MKVLLDTHALLWAALSSAKIPAQISKILLNERNTIFVSAATAWEIATKFRIGKLPDAEILEQNFEQKMSEAGYELLPITVPIALRAGRLTGDHRDPFDRILAAQALTLDIPIISADEKLDGFGVHRIW